MKVEELLQQLFSATASELLKRVTSGEAKPQDLAVAVKFLKDNGVECLPQANKDLAGLKQLLGDDAFAGPDNLQ